MTAGVIAAAQVLPGGGECLVERIRGQPLHVRGDMAVAVEGHADVGVAEPFLHNLGVHALGQEQGGARVAQVVEPDPGQAGGLGQLRELERQAVGVPRTARPVGEDEVVIPPELAQPTLASLGRIAA